MTASGETCNSLVVWAIEAAAEGNVGRLDIWRAPMQPCRDICPFSRYLLKTEVGMRDMVVVSARALVTETGSR